MRHIIFILSISIALQGCISTFAGMSAGNKVEGAVRKMADENKSEEERLHDVQNKELRSCLAGEYKVKCEKEIFLKKCDVSLFKEADLYLTCDADGKHDVYRFYAKGIYEDGTQFEKVLNIVQSKRQ